MTDKEIIEALGCCRKGLCWECPVDDAECKDVLMQEAQELIFRQQGEIEKWRERFNQQCDAGIAFIERNKKLEAELKTAKAEAIKEFAEKLKKRFTSNSELNLEAYHSIMGSMEELYFSMTGKEMVGADNG